MSFMPSFRGAYLPDDSDDLAQRSSIAMTFRKLSRIPRYAGRDTPAPTGRRKAIVVGYRCPIYKFRRIPADP